MSFTAFPSRSRWFRALAIAPLTFGVALTLAADAGAQAPAQATTGRDLNPARLDVRRDQRAEDTRHQLRQVMEQYPPALGRILRLDPTLMANPSYLAPYPELAAFLQAHPDVPRDAEYFFSYTGEANTWEPRDPSLVARQRAMDLWQQVLTGVMVLTIFFTLVATLTWLIRYFVTHRRWLRSVQMQSQLQARVMERLGTSEELLAYAQSTAGRQLLDAPAAPDVPAVPSLAAPFGRILWSIQTALVLVCGGVGLLVIKRYVIEEIAQMMLVLGVLAVSLGIGFGLAALASYMLSERLGLLETPRPSGRPSA